MKRSRYHAALLGLSLAAAPFAGCSSEAPPPVENPAAVRPVARTGDETAQATKATAFDVDPDDVPKIRPMDDWMEKGLVWLAEAQHPAGGWGGGSHAQQQIKDPHAVTVDPATTAFSAMAFLRAGHTPSEGRFKDVVRKATLYLVSTVEEYQADGPKITDVTGTQPQAKLGPLVDTSMTAQYFARVLPVLEKSKEKELASRVSAALDKCVKKIQLSQNEDGSWNSGGGWAPVLQSSLGCTALELADAIGNKNVHQDNLKLARKYQQGNFNAETGKAAPAAAAGVELYAFSSAQRANASEAKAADHWVEQAKKEGKLKQDAQVDVDALKTAGVSGEKAQQLADAYRDNQAQAKRLANDDQLLAGFGNNGGEEYLSYMFTSESLVITSVEQWDKWNEKMHTRLSKVQNPDGSWSGHHCITSPVFCTAAALQSLTADRDAPMLLALSQKAAAKIAQADQPQATEVSVR